MKKGKFIVVEGLDGSGKATQVNLLVEVLRGRGEEVEVIDFPQYEKKSSGLIEEYLSGKYGSAKEVGPKIASIFYACDRYDASFKIKKWLEDGKLVIADRYVSSNAGHQGGKIKKESERREFLEWLYDLEYGLFGLPRPDKIIFLKTTPEFSIKAIKEKKGKDIHEKDKEHLKGAYEVYNYLAKNEKNFETVEVSRDGEFLSPEAINERILKLIS